jgi:hypothetical protein
MARLSASCRLSLVRAAGPAATGRGRLPLLPGASISWPDSTGRSGGKAPRPVSSWSSMRPSTESRWLPPAPTCSAPSRTWSRRPAGGCGRYPLVDTAWPTQSLADGASRCPPGRRPRALAAATTCSGPATGVLSSPPCPRAEGPRTPSRRRSPPHPCSRAAQRRRVRGLAPQLTASPDRLDQPWLGQGAADRVRRTRQERGVCREVWSVSKGLVCPCVDVSEVLPGVRCPA